MTQILINILILTGFLANLYLGRSAWELFSGSLIFILYGSLLAVRFLWPEVPPALSLAGLAIQASLLLYYAIGFARGTYKSGRRQKQTLGGLKNRTGPYYELAVAARLMSQAKLGALMVIERKEKLDPWFTTGTRIDACISKELLFSIFTPPGALHDGALIIQKERIASCGVIVPLSKNPDIPKELGTRHRAALGFSESTDALCLVVSEESGTISVADRGSLYYDISFEKLPALLEQAMRFRLQRKRNLLQTLDPRQSPAKVPVTI